MSDSKARNLADLLTADGLVVQGTGAAKVPSGTTVQRPTPAIGQFRYNTTDSTFEGYDGTEWGPLAGGGSELSKVTYEYTATAGQTTFSGADDNGLTLAYTSGNTLVTYGGFDLPFSDFTATNGTSIILADGAEAGKIVRIIAFGTFTVADHYTKTQADALLAAKATVANFTSTGIDDNATATAITIDASQNTTFGGNLVIGTAGKGIDFNPAGTGAAANTLDDYEEGTWVPVGVAITVGVVTRADYVKVGKKVHISLHIDVSAGTAAAARIQGLPFVSNGYYTGEINFSASNATVTHPHCRAMLNAATVQLMKNNDNTMAGNEVDASHIILSATYHTNS